MKGASASQRRGAPSRMQPPVPRLGPIETAGRTTKQPHLAAHPLHTSTQSVSKDGAGWGGKRTHCCCCAPAYRNQHPTRGQHNQQRNDPPTSHSHSSPITYFLLYTI
eukprot:scaffold7712_cov119-Isochrysis_galbana.AAC.14